MIGAIFIPKIKEETLNKVYIYPQNMRASATLWLWSLKDFAVIVIAALFSALVLIFFGGACNSPFCINNVKSAFLTVDTL